MRFRDSVWTGSEPAYAPCLKIVRGDPWWVPPVKYIAAGWVPKTVRIDRGCDVPAECRRLTRALLNWAREESLPAHEAGLWGAAFAKCFADVLVRAGKRARRRDLPFTLTIDWARDAFEAQGGRCALSGLFLQVGRGPRSPYLPSLDRLRSEDGYVPENVRLVCYAVNTGRNAFGDDAYFRVCRAVASQAALSALAAE